MGIGSEVSRLIQAKADLKASIESYGTVVPEETLISGYPSLVGNLTASGDAVAADIAAGKVAWVDGEEVTGTSTFDADTSDADATAADILDTKTAYVAGAKLTGTLVDYTADYINILDGSGDVMALPEGLASLHIYGVAGRTNLKMSAFPSTWSSNSISTTTFDGCTGITITTVPSMVATITRSAFRGCTSIPSMALPVSVTSFGGDTVFQNCIGMTAFSAPSITSYGFNSLFANCTALQTVTLGSVGKAVTVINANTFTGDTQVGLTITIYVTPGAQPLANSPWGATNATIVYRSAVDGSVL